MSIRLGSLFSGYGGLDLAVEMALGPTDPAFVSDIEPGPCAVLAHRFPDAPNLGDITKVDVSALPDVDVVAGGSPCQDMSLAGKRAGMREGTRSGLWSFQCDIIAAKRPKLVVWENVAGALSARAASRRDVEDADRLAVERRERGLCSCDEPDGTDTCAVCGLPVGERVEPPANMRGLGRVLADLSNLGYDAAWLLLEAADVGAPHHRARVFVTAWPHDATAHLPADPYATFDPDMDVWLTDQPDLFGSATVFRDVWPKSGIMVSAAVGPVPGGWLDAVPSRSGLLSTPNTMDALPARSGEACERALRRGNPDRMPCASTGNLREDVMGLLPTPSANDVKGHNQRRNQDCLEGATAFGMAVSARVDWGRFAPAIRRWERTMGRNAPCPTQASSALRRWLDSHPTMLCARWLVRHAPRCSGPVMPDQPERDRMLECWRRVSDGTDLLDPIWLTGRPIPATLMPPKCVLDLWRERGASRFTFTHLSPRFDEWMMGLPDGWLTDPNMWTGVQGNPRNMQLRLCGNGVVPQQAAAAIRWALGVRGRICGGKGDEL